MYIENWMPIVTARAARGDYLVEAALSFKATLSCPHCKESVDVETSGHIILVSAGSSLSKNVDLEIEGLVGQLSCQNCGVVSVVPKKQENRLKREASRIVTHAWLEKQENALKEAARAEAA